MMIVNISYTKLVLKRLPSPYVNHYGTSDTTNGLRNQSRTRGTEVQRTRQKISSQGLEELQNNFGGGNYDTERNKGS